MKRKTSTDTDTKDIEKKMVYLPVSEITPYEKNPRQISDTAVTRLAQSIAEYGFINPVIINKDKVILAGHTRLMAAKVNGLETVPCVMVENLTPTQERAFRIADNKLGELTEWDYEALIEEISAIKDETPNLDAATLGFDDDELEALVTQMGDANLEDFDDDTVMPGGDNEVAPDDVFTFSVALEFDQADKEIIQEYVSYKSKLAIETEILEKAKEHWQSLGNEV